MDARRRNYFVEVLLIFGKRLDVTGVVEKVVIDAPRGYLISTVTMIPR